MKPIFAPIFSINHFLKSFRFIDASRFFLCLFLIFFPFQIRTLLYSSPLFLSGNFNIYTSFFLHLADIFLLLAFVCWTLSFWQHKSTTVPIQFGEEKFTFLLVLFLAAMLVSVGFADDKLLHMLQTFRFMELFLLYLLICNNVIKIKTVIMVFILGMAFQSLTGIFQYLLQGSLGLHVFGEPAVTAQTLGAGKIDLDTQKIVRAFGTFPHANVLGGALFIAIMMVFANFRRHPWIYWPFVLLLGVALLFTFSRSAFFASVIACLVYISLDSGNRKTSFRSILLSLSLIIFFVVIFRLDDVIFRRLLFETENGNGNLMAALQERSWYLGGSIDMFFHAPFGVGLGGFTQQMQQFLAIKLMPWQYQPVHNIFFLSANELGVLGGGVFLSLFGYLFYRLVKQCRLFTDRFKRHYSASMLALLSGITLIGFFDHYFFSLYPGQVILFLYFALTSSFLSSSRLPARNS